MKRAVLFLSFVLAAAPAIADDPGKSPTGGDGASVTKSSAPPTKSDDLDVRITLSTFLYSQSGGDPSPLVDQGASPQNASPISRFFTDLRFELHDAGFAVDGRVRETTSERYQSGADGGGEYELRTLDYRLGGASTNVVVGRQFIDSVGATKIDGFALNQRLGAPVVGTLFAGAFPQLGSRSVATDYTHAINADGSQGPLVVPVAGGLGAAYQGADLHADLGAAAVYVPQDLPNATADDKSRAYVTSSGYWRPSAALDFYHFALLDVAGADGVNLVNGSFGADARPASNVQLALAVHHVSTDLLQIVARNTLSDPDPTAIGVVQNNIALLKISSDMARAAASVSLAQQRFEISASATARRRPGVSVTTADGSGVVLFPEERSIDAMVSVVDRRSPLGGARLALSAAITQPLGNAAPNRSRGGVARAVASWTFAKQRGQIEADVAGERFYDVGTPAQCTTSLMPLACFGSSTVTAGQAGALVSWRVAREWLLVVDAHVGYQSIRSTFVTPMTLVAEPITWPSILSVTTFARLQWRYR
jgi:hypothetical protein